ncbi:hypothetical protein IFR04_013319 [Cadophora malorum]|uniref:Tat pathway signal sequence n=1 Tax=Cadophora malorum TaxID=108018 RepID=A0A8H7T5V9_9HELO|nr:hypothetical protein IFR04_013319 [Cadophora malorum]
MSKYEPIPPEENAPLPRAATFPKQSILWISHAAFFLLSLTLLVASYRRSDHSCSCIPSKAEIYSPAQSALEYVTQQFQGALNLKSVYKGTPRKELDDAWDALSPGSILPGPTLSISESELDLIGKDATVNATVKIPDELGGGYFATLEVFHNLHCLNLVRMATYKEHYEKQHAFGDHWLRSHIDHCIDMIRQRLTCTADIGLVTAVWVDGYSEPYPDFSTRHQCRDFDKIRDWALDQALNVSMEEMVAARGQFSLSEPPK